MSPRMSSGIITVPRNGEEFSRGSLANKTYLASGSWGKI